MPGVETEVNPEMGDNNEKTMSGPVKIGIIYPPPEVRSMLFKKINYLIFSLI